MIKFIEFYLSVLIFNEIFKIRHVELKMRTSGNIFVKICLKAIRDTFSNIWSAVRVGAAGLNFLVVISNKSGIFKILVLRGEPPHPQSLP